MNSSAKALKKPEGSSTDEGDRRRLPQLRPTDAVADSFLSARRPDRSVPIRRSPKPSPSRFTRRPYHPDLTKFYWMLDCEFVDGEGVRLVVIFILRISTSENLLQVIECYGNRCFLRTGPI